MAEHRFTDDMRIARAPGVLSRRTLDGVLVLAPGITNAVHLSVPGDAIWELLAEPLEVAEMVEVLADHFAVPADTIRAVLQPMLAALLDCGALVV